MARPRNSDGTFASSAAIARRDSQPVRRGDVFSGPITGLGGHNSKTACDAWQPEIGQGQLTQENSFRYRGLVRRVVTQEPRDAMRKSWGIKGLDQEERASFGSFNQRRHFDTKFTELRELARKTGGAGGLMDIDDGNGGDLSKPVDFSKIRRVGSLTVMDRYELDVREFVHNIEAGELWVPKAYYMVSMGNAEVHPSRMLIMHGIKLTNREMMMNQGWGESYINAIWKALRDYLTTHSYLAEAVTRLTQGVLTMPALEGAMTGCDSKAVEDRMEMLSLWMSALGDIALTGDEKYEVVQRGFNGLADVAKTFFDALVVETEIPASILGGQTPGGLNTGENAGEWQSWSSYLGGEQTRTYNPQIRRWVNVVSRAGNSPIGELPDIWDIEWPELYEPNIVEFSSSVAALANAGVLLVNNGIFSEAEVRDNGTLTKAYPHQDITTVEAEPDETEPEGIKGEPELSDIDGDEDIQKTALNGAQFSELRELSKDVTEGALPLQTAVRAAMFGFQMSEAEAREMLQPAADENERRRAGKTIETPPIESTPVPATTEV